MPKSEGDGSRWTVSEDWETQRGIVNDLFAVETNLELAALREHFANKLLFLEVVEAIGNLKTNTSDRDKKRAQHRAEGYHINNGHLWCIQPSKSLASRPRVKCVTQEEAIALAEEEHKTNRHWGRDLVKLKLMDTICSPWLDQSIWQALLKCVQCKNFGSMHLHSLLYLIMW
ncbi:hypothetical protein PISMIDRAFT_102087 [Pisolithus microcarpus 441]|uniref:Integrase zinc-binding domain-containing protein n=1 Tax=Pisolithus microcarpus 441 TaxID=765257 RepID=A0A0C9Z9G4_9AGAM|nr:hypothetical protein PISMIDRAFT_102087 [Pisolithus microcarpus 441]